MEVAVGEFDGRVVGEEGAVWIGGGVISVRM